MNRSASRLVSVAGLLLTGIAAAAPAPLPTRVVRYNDLDLTSARDVATLYVRLQTAAGLACGDEYRPGGSFIDTAWKVCVATVVDAGVRQVDRPALTAYHAVRTGAPSLIRVAKRD
jgi:UrcA family protein